jgi:hypothetical protein
LILYKLSSVKGHLYFEKNEPAAFKNPVLAKLSDWRMLWDIMRGKISF